MLNSHCVGMVFAFEKICLVSFLFCVCTHLLKCGASVLVPGDAAHAGEGRAKRNLLLFRSRVVWRWFWCSLLCNVLSHQQREAGPCLGAALLGTGRIYCDV